MREVVQCCIVGGGPAGMMAGVLLARQGVDVLVVEKHQDFLRDFRGDTIHPSTLELMHELGWATELLDRQHTKMTEVTVSMDGTAVTFADFRKLRVHHPFIAFMPQWDFLDFLAAKGDALANFRLLRSTQMTELLVEKDRVAGILASSENGEVEIRADLVVAADGRHSVARAKAGLRSIAKSAPLDVLWFRLPRQPGDDIPFFQGGRGVLISINRGDYWQLAYAIPTDAYDQLRRDGLSGFRTRIAELVPRLADRLGQIHSWDDVHHLSVRVDRLRRWYPAGRGHSDLSDGDPARFVPQEPRRRHDPPCPAGGPAVPFPARLALRGGPIHRPRCASGTHPATG